MFRFLGVLLGIATLVGAFFLAPSWRWLAPPDGVFSGLVLLTVLSIGLAIFAGSRERFDWLAPPLALSPLIWFAWRLLSLQTLAERIHELQLLQRSVIVLEREFGFACLFAAASSFSIAGAALTRSGRTIAPALLTGIAFVHVGLGVGSIYIASTAFPVEAYDYKGVALGEATALRALGAGVATGVVIAVALLALALSRRASEERRPESKPLVLTASLLLIAMGFWPAIVQMMPAFPEADVQPVVFAHRPAHPMHPTGVLHKDGLLEGGGDVLVVDRTTPWRFAAPALSSRCRPSGNQDLSVATFAGDSDPPKPKFKILQRLTSSWRYAKRELLCATELPTTTDAGQRLRILHFGSANELSIADRGAIESIDLPITRRTLYNDRHGRQYCTLN
jgi:hypothetical protein